MTVSSDVSRVTYAGNGVTAIFAVPYYFLEDSHLRVIVSDNVTGAEDLLTLNSDYSVTGAGNLSGGSVTISTAPQTGKTLTIRRVVPLTQETDYVANDPFPAESHERALDKLTMIAQTGNETTGNGIPENSRALLLGESDVNGSGAYQGNSNRISNIDDPVDPQDAATKIWSQEYIAALLASGQGDFNNAYNVVYPGFNSGATSVGDYLDDRVPFRVSNVAELRTAVGRGVGDRVILLQYDAYGGIGGGLFRQATGPTPADNGVTVFGAPGNVRWIREQTVGPIDVRWAGAVPAVTYSDGMFDSKDAVARAQAAAGTNGVVHFPLPQGWTTAHYLLDQTGLNLSGSYISADPGVVIHAPFTSDNSGEKPRLASDVTFSEDAPSGSNDYVTQRGANLLPLVSAVGAGMAAGALLSKDEQRKFSFVDNARAVRISDLNTGAFTIDATGMTIVADQVTWANPASAGANAQGVEFAASAGAEIECLVHNISGGGSSGIVYFGARAVGPNGAASAVKSYRAVITSTVLTILNGTTTVGTVAMPHPADQLGDVHGVTRIGIRIGAGGRSMQAVVNGKPYGNFAFGSGIAQSIFFAADQSARATVAFKYPMAKKRDMLGATKQLKVAALGDSLTRGARSSNEWPELLRQTGAHLPGIGGIAGLSNQAVSGITARTVAANLASYDFVGFDYVLVMLGTNDTQSYGAGGVTQFYSDIVNIGAKIVTDGAKPIFGIFPTFTSSAITGNGNATVNLDQIPHYQHIIRERVANAGWGIAEADDFFGDNYGLAGSFTDGLSSSWYNDNIHPNTKGQIAMAAAFASALSRDILKPVRGCYVSMIKPVGTFAINSEATNGILKAVLEGNTVTLSGSVSGGAASQTIGALPSWGAPSSQTRQAIFARTGGAQVLASVEIRNDGNIVSGIAWGTEQADLSISYHL